MNPAEEALLQPRSRRACHHGELGRPSGASWRIYGERLCGPRSPRGCFGRSPAEGARPVVQDSHSRHLLGNPTIALLIRPSTTSPLPRTGALRWRGGALARIGPRAARAGVIHGDSSSAFVFSALASFCPLRASRHVSVGIRRSLRRTPPPPAPCITRTRPTLEKAEPNRPACLCRDPLTEGLSSRARLVAGGAS